MSPFILSLIANVCIALVLIVTILFLKQFKCFLIAHLKPITAITVGALFALIFFDFIPELVHELDAHTLGLLLLMGLLFFYFLEITLHWHHCTDLQHEKRCEHSHTSDHEHGNLMFLGTALHNIFHGVVIYSSFSISIETGVALSIGILLHSMPQNLANFVMNHNSHKSVYIASAAGIFGALLCYPFGAFIDSYKFFILAFTTGGLLYLSLSDILPSVNGNAEPKEKYKYLAFIIIGIVCIQGFNSFLHEGHNHGDNNEHEIHEHN